MCWLNAKSLCVSLANVSNKSIFATRTVIAKGAAERFDVCGKVPFECPIIFSAPSAVVTSEAFLVLILTTGWWVSGRFSDIPWVMLKRQCGRWHSSGCTVDQISVGFPVDSLNHRLSDPWQIVGRFSKINILKWKYYVERRDWLILENEWFTCVCDQSVSCSDRHDKTAWSKWSTGMASLHYESKSAGWDGPSDRQHTDKDGIGTVCRFLPRCFRLPFQLHHSSPAWHHWFSVFWQA